MNKYLYSIFIALVLLGGLFFYEYFRFNDGKLHLVMCDVGQGDAIFIRTANGSDILIDGGPDDSVLTCLKNHMPFWDRDIEIMVLTHPHADHLTGLISVVKRYNVMHYFTENVEHKTLINKKLQDTLAANNLTAKYTYSGDRIDLSDKTSLLTIWPEKTWVQSNRLQDKENNSSDSVSLDINGFSLIQLLSFGNFKVLLTGDASVLIQDKTAAKVGKIDVLKVPHHGSKTGMSDYFLKQIRPNAALISVGDKNRYGHPAKPSLDLLENNNVKYFRTDTDSEVEVVSDGNTFWIY